MIDIEKLKQNFTGEVDTSEEAKKQFSRDASIFEITPEVVVSPKTIDDIKHVVTFATEQKKQGHPIGLTPRAGGTDMTGAAIGNSIIINFLKYLHTIGPVITDAKGRAHITVDPGAYYRDIEAITSVQNLEIPAYPASKSICAIGGMVGNNSGGEKSLAYGQMRNYIQELRVVLADGNEYTIVPLSAEQLQNKISQPSYEGQLYKKLLSLITANRQLIAKAKPTTSKNSAGYYLWDVWDGTTFDMTKLLVGSQGTLGIITSITCTLVPIKPYSKLLVLFVRDTAKLGDIISLIDQHRPESFELYDDHTLRLALQFLPDMAKKMGTKIFSLLWKFMPELWMSITRGLPKLVLLAEFTGNNEIAVIEQVKTVEQSIRQSFAVATHIAKTKSEALKYWTVRRESFNLLRQHAHGRISSPFVEDIIVHPEQLPEFLPKLDAIFKKYPTFEYTIAGHAGDANFHIIPFVDLKKQHEHELVLRLSNEVYSLIAEYNGSITAEHNDGIAHGAFLHKMYSPEVLELFRQVKRLFDPLDIFNPGKKVQATMQDFNKYMRRS